MNGSRINANLSWRRLAVSGWLAATMAGCSKQPTVQDESIALAKMFAATAPAFPKQAGGGRLGAVKLALDASLSMRGFAGCNAKPTGFNTILDRLTTDLAISSVIKFGALKRGQAGSLDVVPLSRAIHCPAFYSRLQNPDYELYRHIAADSTGSAYIYLTDGVQSDFSGTNQSPSVGELKQWLSQGSALAVLVFRSEFEGDAWSEQQQRMTGPITVPARPFYAIVLASEETAIDEILSKLSQQVTSRAELIRFSPDAVRCAVDLHKGIPKLKRMNSPPWAMVKLQSIKDSRLVADYRCAIDTTYPFASVQPKLTAAYTTRTDLKFPDLGSVPPGWTTILDSLYRTDKGSVAEVELGLPKENKGRFAYYDIRFDPLPGALRASVGLLSTDSDSDPGSFDRTYRFSWLIEQLGRTHLARTPWVPFSITIQYN